MRRSSLLSIGFMLAPIVGLTIASQTGCVLDDEFLRVEDTFVCQSNADCGEPGFACDPSTNTCKRDIVLCTDKDMDGYGAGEIRDDCENAEEDPNDNDPEIYPGAPEACDGKDNNGDGTTDEPPLCPNGEIDCVNLMLPYPGTQFRCIDGGCQVTPSNFVDECAGVTLPCLGGVYDRTEADSKMCL